MRILLPLLLLVLLLGGGAGLFTLQKSVADGKISFGGGNGAMGTALSMVVDDLTGNTTIKTEGELSGFIPPAPEGWTVREYTVADGEAITGEELQRTNVSKSTTNDLMLSFGRDMAASEGAEAVVYEKDDLKMALRMRLIDRFNERSVRGSIMAAISTNMEVSFGSNGAVTHGLFAKLDGIEVIRAPRRSRIQGGADKPVNYRVFNADIGKLLDIQMITNAADADIAAVFSQIDMQGLNEMLPEPAVSFRPGVGWQIASTEPLSTVPPGPSLASKAYDILHDGRIYPAAETEVMDDIVRGRVHDWSDVDIEVTPTENLLALLGAEPDYRLARRMAARMYADESLDRKMRGLLNEIARGKVNSQAAIYTSSYFRGMTITPDFRSLMAMLPVGEVDTTALETGRAVAPTAEEIETGPVIRRGVTVSDGVIEENCTIELGVRRCVLDDG